MKCRCGSRLKTINSRHSEDNTIRRKKECSSCGREVHTIEVARETHCKNGHKLTTHNTKMNKQGYVICVTCKNLNNKKYMREIRSYGEK